MGDRSSNFRPHRFWTAKTLDRETRLFYGDLKYCISRVCPKIKVRRRQINPWWNADLSSQRSKVRHLQQQVMKHRDDFPLWVQYKQARNNFCKAIRVAKKLAWKSYTEDASNMDGMLKVSRAILQRRQPQVGHLKKRDGTYTQTRGEVLDTLLDEFFPDSTKLKGAQTSPLHYVIKDDIPDLFSPRKLEVAFKSF